MDFIAENDRSRTRLQGILDRLTKDQWGSSVKGGWTAGTLLCHLAFWDHTTAVRLKIWRGGGRLATPPDHEMIDAINDSVRLQSACIGYEDGIRLVRESSIEIDSLVAMLTPAQLQELNASGRERWYCRSFHRMDHIPLIESVVGG